MEKETYIPIINFSNYALDKDEATSAEVEKLAGQVCDAFSSVGFLYVTHHGIPHQLIREVEGISEKFFALPAAKKAKYLRKEANHGWVCLEMESLNPERPGDLKEAFNITPSVAKMWPDEDVTGFQETVMMFHHQCDALTQRLLRLMAVGLKLQNPSFFSECHKTYEAANATTLRLLHYPAVPEDTEIKEGQVRCGEHSDYGSITLLFQDNIGGLEVCHRDGYYVPATPVEGAIIVNIGDLMQRWTADKLISTKHRVLIPEVEIMKRCSRRSMAYFVHPDDDCLVSCIDGSNKYPPITALDYLNMRFAATY